MIEIQRGDKKRGDKDCLVNLFKSLKEEIKPEIYKDIFKLLHLSTIEISQFIPLALCVPFTATDFKMNNSQYLSSFQFV